MRKIKRILFFFLLFTLIPLFYFDISKLGNFESVPKVIGKSSLLPFLRIASTTHPLVGLFDENQFAMVSGDQVRSGSVLFKYKDTYDTYTYFDNVSDDDWVTCVPMFYYSDLSGWGNYEVPLSNLKFKKIKDLGWNYNSSNQKYTISDIKLTSLYSEDFSYSGGIHDIITFRVDGKNIKISGVYRVVWSYKLNNSVLREILPLANAISSMKREINKKTNILNDSSDSINGKYRVHKDDSGNFHLLNNASKINNIYVLTSSDDSKPLDSIDVPVFEDNYSVIKIADFDSDDNKWIPTLPDSSWNDNLEEKIWDTGRFYVSVEYDNLLTYYDLKWLKNGQGSYIYDIVHLTSDNKCDFARRVALVGNNTKAMNAIKDIPSFGDESDLKLRYSNIAKKYNNEHPKIKEIEKETEEKIEELKDQDQEQDENQTNKKDQIIVEEKKQNSKFENYKKIINNDIVKAKININLEENTKENIEKTVNNIKDNLHSLIKNTGDDTKYRLILLSLMLTCHTTLIFTSRKNEDL